MLKKRVFFILFVVCVPVYFAGLGDAADGYLTDGEYEYGVWLENNDELVVMGGGADVIDMWDYSKLKVQYTSLPLGLDVGGVYDIHLSDNSSLEFYGGATEAVTLYKNATAAFKSGQINYVKVYGYPNYSPLVTIYCQTGYQMDQSGITGLWENGNDFEINFIDVGDGYPATSSYINVETIPEPATMLLIGLGGLLIRRKKP